MVLGHPLSDTTMNTPSQLLRDSAGAELCRILEELIAFRTDGSQESDLTACLNAVEARIRSIGSAQTQRVGRGGRQLVAALNTPRLADVEQGLMLCGHLDVVPGDPAQFQARYANDRLYGRGAVDMKGSIACFLHLLPFLAAQPFPVILAFTTDEESRMEGIQEICDFLTRRRIHPSLTLLGEPTGGSLGTASSGLQGMRTEFHGRAAHSSRPADGINALYLAARFLNRLEELGQIYAPRGILVNAGELSGGSDPGTVPNFTELNWGLRCFSAQGASEFMAEAQACARHIEQQYPGSRLHTRTVWHFPVFQARETTRAEELAAKLGYALQTIPYTTEAGFLQEVGQRVLLLGAGHPREAHRADESILIRELADFEQALQTVCHLLSGS